MNRGNPSGNNQINGDFPATEWQVHFLAKLGHQVDFTDSQTNLEKIKSLLSSGVWYEDNKKKFWADGKNSCFAIYAKGLKIGSSGDKKHCQWSTVREDKDIQIAEVKDVTCLEVEGSFNTKDLSRGVRYKVSFLTKMAPSSNMKGQLVHLKLTLGSRKLIEQDAKLPEDPSPPNNSWYELKVGEFEMTNKTLGDLIFTIEKRSSKAMTGLIIKGVEIKAQAN